MLSKRSLSFANIVKCFLVILACTGVLLATVPQGWYLAGSKPSEYEVGTDPQNAYNDHASVYLKSKSASLCAEELKGAPSEQSPATVCQGFGTLMQDFRAVNYLGKRVRLSAFVKSESLADWAGLWMRVDKGTTSVAFDNMQSRPIKGTANWQRYEVVLDVPKDATGIAFGILLSGPGKVWINSVQFEIVGTDVPTTAMHSRHDKPSNLDFEK
jgi:hypothetical protein